MCVSFHINIYSIPLRQSSYYYSITSYTANQPVARLVASRPERCPCLLTSLHVLPTSVIIGLSMASYAGVGDLSVQA